VLGIVVIATKAAADAQTGVDLESLLAVGMEQFDRGRTLPGGTVFCRVEIDAGLCIEDI
jgi:hypothetical protein